MNGMKREIPLIASVLIVTAMVLLCVIVFQVVLLAFSGPAVGITRFSLLLLQTLQQVAMVVGVVLSSLVLREKMKPALLLNKPNNWTSNLLAVLMMMLFIPVMNCMEAYGEMFRLPAFMHGVEELLRTMEEAARQTLETMLAASNFGGLVINLLVIALGAALSEEVIFRGILLHLFRKHWSLHVAIWVSAILFSAIHFQIYGFIPRMLMGALFGYLAVWSGSLLLPIVAHFTNNACVVVAEYALGEDTDTIFSEPFMGEYWWVMVLTTLAALFVLSYIKRLNTKHPKED